MRIIPFFVSSDSEVIDAQKYMFGIIPNLNFPLPIKKLTIPTQIKKVIFGTALNNHEYESEILFERLQDVAVDPKNAATAFIRRH